MKGVFVSLAISAAQAAWVPLSRLNFFPSALQPLRGVSEQMIGVPPWARVSLTNCLKYQPKVRTVSSPFMAVSSPMPPSAPFPFAPPLSFAPNWRITKSPFLIRGWRSFQK